MHIVLVIQKFNRIVAISFHDVSVSRKQTGPNRMAILYYSFALHCFKCVFLDHMSTMRRRDELLEQTYELLSITWSKNAIFHK